MIQIGLLMHVYCDFEDCLVSAEFKGLERIDLAIAAQRAGWKVTFGGYCLCPEHNTEKAEGRKS